MILALLLILACRIVPQEEAPAVAPKATSSVPSVKPPPPAPPPDRDAMTYLVDPLKVPDRGSWRPGSPMVRRAQRVVVEKVGSQELFRVPLLEGETIIVGRESSPLEQDLGALRYQRVRNGPRVEETLTLLQDEISAPTVARLRSLRGPLYPKSYLALLRAETALAAEPDMAAVALAASSPVEVLWKESLGRSRIRIAGRALTVPDDALFALPTHVMLASAPEGYTGDIGIPFLFTGERNGMAQLVPPEGPPVTADPHSLSPIREESATVLGDLSNWIWIPEMGENRRLLLLQPQRIRGLLLPTGTVLTVDDAGTIASVDGDTAVVLGGRRLPPGTRLLLVSGCDFREVRLDVREVCLSVEGESLVERR